jgi:hypothetical protein
MHYPQLLPKYLAAFLNKYVTHNHNNDNNNNTGYGIYIRRHSSTPLAPRLYYNQRDHPPPSLIHTNQ